MASLDCLRYPPRDVGEFGSQGRWRHCVETAAWVCLSPCSAARAWHPLHTRITKVRVCTLSCRNALITGRWLISKRRFVEAFLSLAKYRGSELLAARELYYIHAQMQYEEILIQKSGVAVKASFFTRIIELFTIPRLRRAVQASGIVMIAQQMCGSEYFGRSSLME